MFKHNSSKRDRSRPRSRSSQTLSLARSFKLHQIDYQSTVCDFYVAINTPVALSCYMLFIYGEYDQLVNKEADPRYYCDSESFRNDFAACSFLRKSAVLNTSYDKKQAALETFIEGEARCKGVNLMFRTLQSSSRKIHRDDWSVINSMIRKIDRILGNFDIDEMLAGCRWGPGSTLSVKGSSVSSSHKFDFERDITIDAYSLFGDIFQQAYPSWENLKNLTLVKGNKIVTVPKNAKTDRTIAIEPGLNVWIQLGIGRLLRRKLRFAGYNLDSDLKNQRGAYLGSLDDSIATIDFRAASDSLSRELVEFLLPPRWVTILNAARSPYYELNGKVYLSEKFSTMGNGFTFELESLIFVSLALALCEVNSCDDNCVSIFGDDLVLPSCVVSQLTRLGSIFGLQVNDQKSYSSGPFRESCGSYYFEGRDVKPIFLKTGLRTMKDVYRLANSIRIFSHRYIHYGCDGRFQSTWNNLVHKLPKELRFFGNLSSGDSAIHANLGECSTKKPKWGWEGYTFKAFPEVPLYCTRATHGLLLARLHTSSWDTEHNNSVPLRARTRMTYKKAMLAPQWYEFGPWIQGHLTEV